MQWNFDCAGVKLMPSQPMLPLEHYHLVPSIAPLSPPNSTRQAILVSFFPTVAGAEGGASNNRAKRAAKQGSRQRAQVGQSFKSSNSKNVKRRAQNACHAGPKKTQTGSSLVGLQYLPQATVWSHPGGSA